ncbi:hypothetical protein BGZ82_006806 [Podila clonocystis]|nr:hypothetical protein BGZ82_006806 [Podila clonocystis]
MSGGGNDGPNGRYQQNNYSNSPNYTLGSKQEFHDQPSYNNSTHYPNYTYDNNLNAQHQQQPQQQFSQFQDHDQPIGRKPTQHQLQQLKLQKHHQERLQEQISAEDSLRNSLQQHRVPRQNPAGGNGVNTPPTETKPPNYYSYPPQPSTDDDDGHTTDAGLKSRLHRLFNFPCSTYGKSMILVIGIEALLVIIMQSVIVAMYFNHLTQDQITPGMPAYLDTKNQSRSIPAYMLVFVFAQLFQLVLTWDAVRAQNTIEIIGIVAFNLCCFAYSIFEISQIRSSLFPSATESLQYEFFAPGRAQDLLDSIKPFLIVVVVVIGVTQCLVTWLAYQLFQEFGWKIYKKIGADPNMKKMYRAYQIYLVLIKIDLFFFVGFSIQFIFLTLAKQTNDPEYWVTIFFLPATLLILMVAVYAVRHESRRWMAFFLTTMLAGVGYFIFKVVRMYRGTQIKMEQYIGINKFLTLFAALCLITILATIANAAVCYRNFGKGLKPHIMRNSSGDIVQNSTSSPNGRVLEID